MVVPLGEGRHLVTAIPTSPGEPWTREKLKDYLIDLEVRDNVSCAAFRKLLLFCGTVRGEISLRDDVLEYLDHMQIQHIVVEVGEPGAGENCHHIGMASQPILEGPYLWTYRELRPIYRLYEDKVVAFMDYLTPSNRER